MQTRLRLTLSAALGAVTTLPSQLQPPVGQGAMGGHYTLAQIEAQLNRFARDHKQRCRMFMIGRSLGNRAIWALKISDNPQMDEGEPEVLFDALMHANEPMTATTTLYLMDWLLSNYSKNAEATHLVNNRELFFVPCVNPDGYEYNRQLKPGGGGNWRKNRGASLAGVDLNRNWPTGWGSRYGGYSTDRLSPVYRGPSPLSEPESRALATFIQGRKFVLVVSAHTTGEKLLYPFGYQPNPPANVRLYELLSRAATAENGIPAGQISKILYYASGTSIDHYHARGGMFAFTPELGLRTNWPQPADQVKLVNRHLPMFKNFAHLAGAFVKVENFSVREQASGRRKVGPGETGELRVAMQNFGRLGTRARLHLRSLTTGVTVGRSTVDYTFGPFQQVTNATPFLFSVWSLTSATTAKFELSIGYDGYNRREIIDVPLGRRSRFSAGTGVGSYGSVVGAIGDWNGDGYNDFAFGAPDSDRHATDAGTIHLYSGKDHRLLDSRAGAKDWRLGASIDAGDLNGDGKADMVFGIPGYNTSNTNWHGAVGVQYGGQRNSVIWLRGFAEFGSLVASGGDVNGDGHDDVAVAQASNLVCNSGKDKRNFWVKQGLGARIQALDMVGDIDNDGRDDILLGMPAHSGGRGRIEVRSGRDGSLIRGFTGRTVEGLGHTVADLGDIDGDGVHDYMFGSPGHNNKRGNVGVVSGRNDTWIRVHFGSVAGERLGSSVSGAGGDIDGDGTSDYLISSQPTDSSQKGVVRAYSGKTGRVIRTLTGNTQRYGEALRGIDTNGDSVADFVIGEPGSNVGYGWVTDCPAKPNPPAFKVYGETCRGSGDRLPRIGYTGSFRPARSFRVTLSSAPAGTVAFLKLAIHRTRLPLDAFGAPGCVKLYSSSVVTLSAATNNRGQAGIGLPLSPNEDTVGLKLYWQWLVYDRGANRLKLTFSNAAESVIGAR